MDYVVNGIMGLCVGDALGVPVEFKDRESLSKNPVTNMREYGTHKQPAAIGTGIYNAMEYYRNHAEFAGELQYFERLGEKKIKELPVESIKSSGYVVDTLEAAIWCLLNSADYKECVLKAVNLGDDTDTVAAVAGGLAGLRYGYESIPKEWIDKLPRREYIENLCNRLYVALSKKGIKKLCDYIPFFETATKDSVCSWRGGEKTGENQYTMPFPDYEPTLLEFIREVYKTNLFCFNYLEVIESRGIDPGQLTDEIIENADFELLKAILIGYVRQERFHDGLWASAVRDKS